MASKLALVTGAYGFLGRHVARHFASLGWEVVGLGHGGWSPEDWRQWGLAEWHPCDITMENLLVYGREPEAIMHCAGSGNVGFSMTHPAQDFKRTVEGTLHVLEFMRLHAPDAKLVYPSSAAVYGHAETMPISEDAPLSPVSPYGVHKRIAEELCRSYGKHFGVASAVIRFFSVYGRELRKQLIADACRKAMVGDTVFPGTGKETRDWLHSSDAVALCHAALAAASAESPVVNGGCGEPVSVREVLTLVFSLLRPEAVIQFTGHSRAGDPRDYRAAISKARALNWSPQTDWKDGVRDYVEWRRTVGV
jgi:UDP-glucose 4-epimerase